MVSFFFFALCLSFDVLARFAAAAQRCVGGHWGDRLAPRVEKMRAGEAEAVQA